MFGQRQLNALLNAAGKAGNLKLAERVFDEFTLSGLRRDVATYSIMVSIYGKLGAMEKAVHCFAQMEYEGKFALVSVKTLAPVLRC